MRRNIYLSVLIAFSFWMSSCDSKDSKTEKNDTEAVHIVIDSSAFKVPKTELKDFKVRQETLLSSPEEVAALVNLKNRANLDAYQKFAQEFISACANKDYSKAAQYLSYTGAEKNRIGADHLVYENASEKGIVKTTVDVVYNFLAESKDYKFISSKTGKTKSGKKLQLLEITFFKKEIGVNRRFFEIVDTPKGMLIANMK